MRKAAKAYTAQKPGELSFKEGDAIVLLAAPSGGMVKGMKPDGSVGLVPEDLVRSF